MDNFVFVSKGSDNLSISWMPFSVGKATQRVLSHPISVPTTLSLHLCGLGLEYQITRLIVISFNKYYYHIIGVKTVCMGIVTIGLLSLLHLHYKVLPALSLE